MNEFFLSERDGSQNNFCDLTIDWPLTLSGWGEIYTGSSPVGDIGALFVAANNRGDGTASGGMPEWLKGTGCKPVGYAYVGSNPTPSTIAVIRIEAGVAQW